MAAPHIESGERPLPSTSVLEAFGHPPAIPLASPPPTGSRHPVRQYPPCATSRYTHATAASRQATTRISIPAALHKRAPPRRGSTVRPTPPQYPLPNRPRSPVRRIRSQQPQVVQEHPSDPAEREP